MEKDEDIIEIIVDDSQSVSDKKHVNLYNVKAFFSGLRALPLFVKLYILVIAAITVIAVTAGIFTPKSNSAIDRRLNALRTSDKAYLEKQAEYQGIQSETEQQKKHIEEKQAELERLNNSQDNLDKLSQKNSELEDEKKQLQDEVNLKQKTLNALDISLDSYIRSSITLSSGRYTVGENISEGKYTITGTGSIVVSNSGTARINKPLKSDGESLTLKNGDIVKIDGNAKLVLE